MCQGEGDEEERAEKKTVWTELSVFVCFAIGRPGEGVRGGGGGEEASPSG